MSVSRAVTEFGIAFEVQAWIDAILRADPDVGKFGPPRQAGESFEDADCEFLRFVRRRGELFCADANWNGRQNKVEVSSIIRVIPFQRDANIVRSFIP
jgi:hypothetical protein